MILKFKYLSFFLFVLAGFFCSQLVLFLISKEEISVFKNAKILPLLMFFALLVFIIFSLFELKKEVNYPLLISLSLILGGGLSNLFDALRLGGVADYLNFYFWQMNLADIFILLGVIIFFALKLAHVKKF